MKINPSRISVSVYRHEGETKAIIQMTLPKVSIEKDANGIMNDAAKTALQVAMREALYQWELNVQEPD